MYNKKVSFKEGRNAWFRKHILAIATELNKPITNLQLQKYGILH